MGLVFFASFSIDWDALKLQPSAGSLMHISGRGCWGLAGPYVAPLCDLSSPHRGWIQGERPDGNVGEDHTDDVPPLRA